MVINWFPGHMTKALRTMEAEIKNVDCTVYVLDSRAPFACLNPEFDKIIKNKEKLIVLNKIDICDLPKLKENIFGIKKYFGENADIILLNSTLSGVFKTIIGKIEKLCQQKILRYKNKGLNSFIKAMVIGVPNTGKSTLVNSLCGKAKTKTGNKAGITRGKQWVTVSQNVQIMDTAGTLYPKLANEKTARFLAYIGSIKDEVLDINELAICFIDDVLKQYPNCLTDRYKIIPQGQPYEIIEEIAKSRHYTTKGGEIDYERTCRTIIDDFRKQYLGKITLI